MSSRENYLRMLILTLPFLDYNFFYKYNFSQNDFENLMISAIEHYSHSYNLDMTKTLIQFYYPKENYNHKDLLNVLENISISLLTYHHNRLCVDMFDDYIFNESSQYISFFKNKVLDYIELNKLISDSLLLAFYNYHYDYDLKYCIRNHMIQPISVVSHQLNTYLLKGIAETHTHVVGSIPFERQWNWIHYQILDQDESVFYILDEIDNNQNVQFQKNMCGYKGKLKSLISSSVVLRLMLILFLVYLNYHKEYKLRTFLCEIEKKLGYEERNIFARIFYSYLGDYNEINLSHHQMNLLIKEIDKMIYKSDIRENNTYHFSHKVYLDFVRRFLDIEFIDQHKGQYNRQHFCSQYIEYIFQFESIKYISTHNDNDFEKLFLHYIRIKNFMHSFIAHSSDIKGFLEFQYFFKRQSMIYDIPQNMFTNIFNTYIYDHVQFLEMRIGHVNIKTSQKKKEDMIPEIQYKHFEELLKTYISTLSNFITSYLNFLNSIDTTLGLNELDENVPQVGLILHFNKRYDDVHKCWDSYFQVRNDSLLRFKEYQEICFLNLIAFQKIREKIIYADEYLVGIDGASNELLTEPWVLAPIFRSVKARYSHILKERALKYGIKLKSVKEMGITYHVGEVFHSIGSGLRHVDEVIDYYGFQNGERIGHATVLGISIDDFICHHKVVSLPAIEFLDNLLWLHHLKSSCNLFKDISISFIEDAIWKVTHFIYDIDGKLGGNSRGIDIHHLYLAYIKQFDCLNFIENSGVPTKCLSNFDDQFCVFKSKDNWDENLLFYSRHCRCFLINMTRVIQIDIDNEMIRLIYKEAQQYLIDKVARKGIVVETNPLSNVTIGEIDSIKNHPIFKMNDSFHDNHNHVMVSINADDPGVFGTTLKNQYGFILQALLDSGISMEKALNWINMARKNGLNSTFINRRRKTKKEIINELTEMQKDLEYKLTNQNLLYSDEDD